MDGCPFCAIVDGREPAEVVYEDDATLALFPKEPATLGHTMIITKRHHGNFLGVPADEVAGLWSAVTAVGNCLRDVLKPEGMNVISSAGEAASQSVFHVHVHLVPRWRADAVHGIYARARTVADAEATPDPAARRAAAHAFRRELGTLCAPYLPTATATGTTPPPRALCRRITKHLAGLFVFVADPAVPATNNAAERSLRHLVVARKISGGTRSSAGTTAKMTLAPLFGTWRAQGRTPFDECRRLLAANPQI